MRRLLVIYFVLIGSVLLQNNAFAQVSFGGIPASFKLAAKSLPQNINLPAFSIDSMKQADSSEMLHGRKTFRFARTFNLNYSPANSGTWMQLDDGSAIWRLAIASKSAYSMGLTFSEFHPVPGAKIFIYNVDHSEIRGAFTSENLCPGNFLNVYPIPGDQVIVEYDLPKTPSSYADFSITLVSHDYRNVFGKKSEAVMNSLTSGSCNVDINCSAGSAWQLEKRAVCKLLINQAILCSGTLVNNVKQDGKPYLLTANHCIPASSEAYNSLVIFNYENDTCNKNTVSSKKSISGTWLKATTSKIDFSLVELGEKPPASFNTYYAGWNRDTLGITNTTTIHHPAGDVKKISYSSKPPATSDFGSGYEYNSHWLVSKWNYGDTEGGSSGCPLFDQNHYLIGTLTGGISSCSNPDSDYFQKFSRSWADLSSVSNQLKNWLDPDATDARQIPGFNPYSSGNYNCSLSSNILATESHVNPVVSGNTGSYAGVNGLGILNYADQFITTTPLAITAIALNVAALASTSLNSSITLKIWKGKSSPDSLIYSEDLLYKTLVSNSVNTITLYNPVNVSDTFFLGYTINYQSGDNIAIFIAPDRNLADLNTAYALLSNNWTAFPAISQYLNLSTSLGIAYQVCNPVSITGQVQQDNSAFSIFPNPTEGILNIKFSSDSFKGEIELIDLTGKKIFNKKIISEPGVKIDLSFAPRGIYIIKAISENQVISKKLIKL